MPKPQTPIYVLFVHRRLLAILELYQIDVEGIPTLLELSDGILSKISTRQRIIVPGNVFFYIYFFL